MGVPRYPQLSLYQWDGAGRLTHRENLAYGYAAGESFAPHVEHFNYDTRDRLIQTNYQDPLAAPGSVSVRQIQRYDASGNILCKSDVRSAGLPSECDEDIYAYGQGIDSGSASGPHAIDYVDVHGQRHYFEYDNTGNLESDGQRLYGYTTGRRMAFSIRTDSFERTDYLYGSDRQKRMRVRQVSGVYEFTVYVGDVELDFEGFASAHLGDWVRAEKHIEGFALITLEQSGASRLFFKHVDHQGSLKALSDENGEVEAWMSFDPWGARRSMDVEGWASWMQFLNADIPAEWDQHFRRMLDHTDRGYTGHEHIDGLGLIHMNGRVYDPLLARFIQSDPFVEDTGTLNRYTYVHNNPLGWVDPSGFTGRRATNTRADDSRRRAFFSTVISMATLIANPSFTWKLIGTTTATYVGTGSLRSALVSAGTAIAFNQAGVALGDKPIARVVAHGVIGGVSAAASGGDFGRGFASASFTKLVSPNIQRLASSDQVGIILAGVVSGISSEISGGRFGPAFVRGVLGFAFNQIEHSRRAAGNAPHGSYRWAHQLAKENTEGGIPHSVIQLDDGSFNVMKVPYAGIRNSLGDEGLESLAFGSDELFCEAFCTLTAPLIAIAPIVGGDLSDQPTSESINDMSEGADKAGKALDILAGPGIDPNVRGMAEGLKVAPPVVQGILAIPAAANNYKACMEDCTTGLSRYFE